MTCKNTSWYWLALISLAVFLAGAGGAFAQSPPQPLPNGIVLPQPWPPVRTPTQVYQLPFYITNPPAVIPIDVGRQLFVDDFLIQQTTMVRTVHQPVMYPLNPIVVPVSTDTSGIAMPYSDGVWFDPTDQTFKMWFFCGPGNMICYTSSPDGKNWSRAAIPGAVIPGTDAVLQIGGARDSTTVWMDLNDPVNRFKAFAYYPPANILVYYSPNGINQWVQQTQFSIDSISDRTTVFWNPFRKVWVDGMREQVSLPAASGVPTHSARARMYAESPDLTTWTPANFTSSFWTGPDVNDPPYVPGGTFPELYNLDAVAYESVMVGMFSWFYPGPADPSIDTSGTPGPDLVELGVGFSRDGFNWVRPTRGSGPSNAFIPASNTAGTWNMGNTQSAGGAFLVVGDELWFYFSGRNGLHGLTAVGSTGLATLRRDGFYSMNAGATTATLTTRPVQFTGQYMFVNVKDPQGSLQVQVLNPTTNQVLATSMPLSTVDSTLQQVTWIGLSDLSSFVGQAVRFQFNLTNGELYSFWVTTSAAGASNGYVAANGPGFTGAVDNKGSAAYPKTVATPEIFPPTGGSPVSSVTVSITTGTLGATIYYTVDGTSPSTMSPVYSGPFQLTSSTTVRAIAAKTGLSNSAVAVATFYLTSPDATPPTVSFAVPQNGATISNTVAVQATATDNVAMANVQFLVDGTSLGTSTSQTPTYTVSLNTATLTNGTHQLTTVATDTSGNQAQAVVTVTVSNTAATSGSGAIGIDFVGGDVAMGSTETAGVIAQSNWNHATGAASSVPLSLVNQTGNPIGATASWIANNVWETPITDQAGNNRLMKGYLDNGTGSRAQGAPSTVTVSGLNAEMYNIYVYADGDNSTSGRTGIYQLSGPGITTTSITLIDAPSTNFNGTFIQANNSNGNYVLFTNVSVTSGFTVTATPGQSPDYLRAPVNAIQIVPLSDFTLSAGPPSQSANPGGNTSFTATIAPLNGFGGTVNLAVSGLPTGASGSFTPATVGNGAGSSTLNITLTANTTAGNYPFVITATSGAISHTANATLVVTDFTVTATPSSQPVNSGGSTSYTATIAPLDGFTGTVSFSVSGLPSGASGSFTPGTVSNGTGSSALNITLAANTTAGNYPLVITATSGVISHTGNATLVVTDFTVAAAPSSQSVTTGGSTSYTATIASLDGFAGTVSLAVSGLPSGASGTFTPGTVSNGAGSSTLNITLAANTAAGSYPLVITATSGSLSHTSNATLTVTDFTVATSPSSQSVNSGGSTSYTATITPLDGFAGTVSFSVSGLPTGASGSFTPGTVNNGTGSSTLNIALAANMTAGSYPLVITATSGALSRTSNATLIVTDFTVAASPSSQSANPGGSTSYTATITPLDGFAGTVSFSVSGLPTGASGSFTPGTVSNGTGSSTLNITPAANTTAGNYPLVITATSGGISRMANATLVVSDFTLGVGPGTQTVNPGGSTTYTATITPLNGFSGAVTLNANGLPTGATGTFSPISGGSSTLTVTTLTSTPVGSVTFTITGTSGSLSHTTTATLGVNSSTSSQSAIGINFVGSDTNMGSTETAGVVAQSNWNNAIGASSASPLNLVNQTGGASGAAVSWTSDNTWSTPIADQAGSSRMMKGYLDTGKGNPSTATVTGLSAGTYNIYVYGDGDNGTSARTAIYQLSGAGITTTSTSLIDAGSANFNGTFTQANNSSGNYVLFANVVVTSGLMVTVTPGATPDYPRAPLNGMQIVPVSVSPPAPDFTLGVGPGTQTVNPGGSTTYTATITPLNGFSGAVTLNANGLPTGATGTFSPISGGSSTLTVTTLTSTPVGSVTFTITGTSGSLSHTTTATLGVNSSTSSQSAIGINFVGSDTNMGSTETAGVVAQSNWNNAIGASSASPLNLVNQTGGASGAAVSWTSDNTWSTPIADQAGSSRMMKGYLDTGKGNPSTATVTGLSAGTYNIYVYGDGDNGTSARTAIYQLSGAGITTTSTSLIDAGSANFNGTFTQANNSSGNYVLFANVVVTSGFTVTVTPGATPDYPRAPLNGMQIVPVSVSPPAPDFTLGVGPGTQTVNPGGSTTYTATITPLNGFSGAVTLNANGLPTGATGTFSPISGGSSTLTVTTSTSTPVGSVTFTITGTSGSLSHTTTATLGVNSSTSSQSAIGINFVGSDTNMGSTETAGVVAQSNWNNAIGASSASPLNLVNQTGGASGAAVSWVSNDPGQTPIVDQPGNNRMMKGYLDTGTGSRPQGTPSTVTVSGLSAGTYNIYVYADGNNSASMRAGIYQLSGPGVTVISITLIDAANANFDGTFTQANNSSGNYVLFSNIPVASGFTLTATPGQSADIYLRAPVNSIQIVPASQTP